MPNLSSPLAKSIAFHLAVFAILLLSGLEIFSRSQQDDVVIPIVVDIIPVGEITNVPPSQKPVSKAKPKPKKPKPPKPKPEIKTLPVVKPEPKPETKPKPKPEAKPESKPKPKPEPPKEEERTDQDDFYSDLLADLEDDVNEEPNIAKSDLPYDPTKPLSITERDRILNMITSQIKRCWNIPAGARNYDNLKVYVDIDITKQGYLKFVGFSSGTNYRGRDEVFRAVADSVRRAVLNPNCNPLRELPPVKNYNYWAELEVSFDPNE